MYTIVAVLTLSSKGSAQKSDIAFNAPAHSSTFLSPFKKMGFTETKANDFNIKAIRDFVKTFKTVDNNRWSLEEDGSSTSIFNSDGITTTIRYDRNGNRQHIIKIYNENKLPADIRYIVKREYYDAAITLIKEVETNIGLIFFVHIQDKDTWKIVRIADGEMKLVENLNKS